MVKGPRIDNDMLLAAGLDLMRQNGQPLSKLPSKGRSMLYRLENGETVRARTCNDHILIVVASRPDEDASLNIEGTDWLLLVMPEIERTPGNVIAYLLPTRDVVGEARRTHQDWLDTNPNTRGENTTWNLWFRADGPEKASGYADKWGRYRLSGNASTEIRSSDTSVSAKSASAGDIKAEVENARIRIAQIAGVSVSAVRISIDFGA